MINGIKPIISKKTKVGSNTPFNVAMNTFLDKLTDNTKSYIQKFDHMEKVVFRTDGGRKYIKVKYFITTNDNDGYLKIDNNDSSRVHCFVDKTTGDIYKPSNDKTPHTTGKNCVKGNIYNQSTYQKTDPRGSWLTS